MQSVSGSNGIEAIAVEVDAPAPQEPAVSDDDLTKHFAKGSVSVSLKYYMSSCECFSAWQSRDLKKFSGTIEKISGYAVDLLHRTKSLCDSHKGPSKARRFRRPEAISDDIMFWELKVDPSNKARVHGFFVGSVFFLVWLDRNHECFKQ